jgi:hypothetical protein
MQAVRSFQLYRKPLVVPERYVSDYTPQERDTLYETFQQIAVKHRRRARAELCAGVGFFAFGIIAVGLQEFSLIWGAMACWLIAVAVEVTGPPLVCPGCDNLIENTNRYCPDCGGTPLISDGFFKAAECTVCGKTLRFGKHRSFRMRFCTHCGVMLDEKGL